MNGTKIARVSLAGVRKEYEGRDGPPVRALQGVDLDIPAGTFVSVEGPSGCGKTTLLNLLGLLDQPSAGEVRWDGQPVGARTERERARLRLTGVGFIFQRFYLLPTLTAEENVALPMRAARVPAPERRARSRALLASVGLGERARAYPHELSGGQEQRVAIARALANRPGLLLADEPTGELDHDNAEQVLRTLVEARASVGATLVVVTHNPLVAGRADRHLVMADGRILRDSASR